MTTTPAENLSRVTVRTEVELATIGVKHLRPVVH